MKPIMIIFLSLCLLLCGCQKVNQLKTVASDFAPPANEVISPENISKEPTGTLNVYFVDTKREPYTGFADSIFLFDNKYKTLDIETTVFTNSKEMDAVINQKLAAGDAPDVILSFQSELDYIKMAQQGDFLDMDPYFKADTSWHRADYFQSVLDAGVIENGRYLMPLGFSIPMFMSTGERLKELGINLSSKYDAPWLLNEIGSAAAFLTMDPSRFTIFSYPKSDNIMCSLAHSMCVPIVNHNDNSIVYDEEALKKIADFGKIATADIDKSLKLLGLSAPLESYFQNTAILFSPYYATPSTMRICTSEFIALGETPVLLPIPSYENHSEYGASIVTYAAVNAATENPTAAYQLVKYLSSQIQSNEFIGVFSVNRKSVMENIDKLSANDGGHAVGLNPIPEDVANRLKYVLEHLTYAEFFDNSTANKALTKYFEPYFNSISSFDDCIAEFEEALRRYYIG